MIQKIKCFLGWHDYTGRWKMQRVDSKFISAQLQLTCSKCNKQKNIGEPMKMQMQMSALGKSID